MTRKLKVVGRDVPRIDGRAKVAGTARYVDDIVLPGMLHARTIRSEVARGRLRDVHLLTRDRAFTFVTARDVPGENVVAAIADDQPLLVADRIEHCEEAIALLAHPDREALLAAKVALDVEPLEPNFDPRRSPIELKRLRIIKGDVDAALDRADVVIEGEYETGAQEQLYIETNGMIAIPEAGGVTVIGSLQCPYYVHTALVRALGLPADRVRVIQAETGGGFGGKEEFPSIVAGHAALLALKSGRPVKLVYDRLEDLVASTKRHPSIVRHRTGVRRDGTLLAMDVDVLLDGGAYTTLSPVVLSRGAIHATGAYRCDHVRVLGRAVKTNTPPNGAFRGFGAPQTLFALEVHMDRIAERLGIDPLDLRLANALREGDTTSTGQRLGRDVSARAALLAAAKRSGYRAKRKRFAGSDRGIGLALFLHGSGFTGSGEAKLASRVALELTRTGVTVHVGSTEIGQGTRTMLSQMVAEALGWPLRRIAIAEVDTAQVPDSGPTVASRTCMIVGGILVRAAKALKRKLGDLTPRAYLEEHGELVVVEHYEKPAAIEWDETTYRGSAYAAYAFGCNVAEVEFEPATGIARAVALTAVIDVGRAVAPSLARGQVEGGVLQGVGFALLEEVVMRDGRMANGQLTNYLIPTTLDAPEIDVELLEHPAPHAPFGAKGVGEAPIDGPAPAIVNALRHLGLDVRAIPATPERLLDLVAERRT
jgi:CO/xanthine dehydrogenase Mo-binding subunit